MNIVLKELIHYIGTVSNIYLREDKIKKFDTDEEFITDIYLVTSPFISLILSESTTFIFVSQNDVLNNDGRPYNLGYLLYDKIKVNLMVNPMLKYSDNRFWLNDIPEMMYTKDSYTIPEKFSVLFF